jgi:hypothetical protein
MPRYSNGQLGPIGADAGQALGGKSSLAFELRALRKSKQSSINTRKMDKLGSSRYARKIPGQSPC